MPHAVATSQLVPNPNDHFMWGCSTTTTFGQNATDCMTSTEASVGPMHVHRGPYLGSSYLGANFTTTDAACCLDLVNLKSLRMSAYSMNPPALDLQTENGAGTYPNSGFDPTQLKLYLATNGVQGNLSSYGTVTQGVIAFLLTIPRWQRALHIPWHEFDNNATSVAYGGDGTNPNYGAFRNAFRIVADIIHAFGNPLWFVGWLGQAALWKGVSSSDPFDYWPGWAGHFSSGLNYVDVACVDVYNEGGRKGSNWDSFPCSIGIPYASEQAGYQSRYSSGNASAVNGWKTTDSSGITWTNGFPGWCEAVGITKMFVGEIGCPRNVRGLTPTWPGAIGITASKIDWIKNCGQFMSDYNRNASHNAKFIGGCYFQPNGRNYDDSAIDSNPATNYLATVCRYKVSPYSLITGLKGTGNPSGSPAVPMPTPATVPALAVGDRYLNLSVGQSWIVTAISGNTVTWHNEGSYVIESWEWRWPEAGGVFDDSSSATSAMAYVGARFNTPPGS